MHSKRLVTAAVILPVMVAAIYFLPAYPYFLGLLVAVAMLAMREFYAMYRVPLKLYLPGVAIGGLLFYMLCRHPAYFMDAIFISLFLLLVLRLIAGKTPSGCMSDIGPLGIGFFYIAGFLSFQWFLREETFGMEYIFLLYTSVWLADSAAYYVGTYLGRNKLYPVVSPNKTFEGAFGSVMGGIIGSVTIRGIFDIPDFTVMGAIVIGGLIGAATLVGDLIESMFKRDAGVKDSGSLIPGHGGLLDKLDGVLIAGPVLYFLLRGF
ncbi:phosphatidate cytidylyltransferase [bacterium BMS3Abin10]|nr:phosphatidate cytidylyltransferase [bacterium BMS3Abin10]GBE39748.1 phosphatidate cytidylyltransferase [bacterium BMS3Bbin08]